MPLSTTFPLSVVASIIGLTQAFAATPEQAKVFSEKAAAYIREVGEEKAFADFTRRELDHPEISKA